MDREILQDLGYKVTVAEDGLAALWLFHEIDAAFDLLLLDLTMPKLNGRDVFAKLREIKPDVNVVFCSGFSPEKSVEDLIAEGARGFVKKLYRESELSRIIAEAINGQ